MNKYQGKALSENATELNHQLYKKGCDYFNNKEFSKAKSAFKECIEYWPNDPQAWLALGNCFDELNKPIQAENCFRKALKYCKKKDVDDYTYNLGNSLFDQEKYKEAITYYSLINSEAKVYSLAQKNLKLSKSLLN